MDFTREKLDEFRSLETNSESATRFTTSSGQRYDLWRIAWLEFRDAPVGGVGAGNYQFRYFEDRRTDRNLTDPHSLPIGLLAETGFVGLALLLLTVAALTGAIAANWRGTPRSRRVLAAGLAATGAVVLGQSAVDWIARIPGIVGIGIVALALAIAVLRPPERRAPRPALPWDAGRDSVALAVAGLLFAAFYSATTTSARRAGRTSRRQRNSMPRAMLSGSTRSR